MVRLGLLFSKKGEMAKLLCVGTRGIGDPIQAALPFLVAKGAIDGGHETGIVLMGETAPLIEDLVRVRCAE